MFKVNRSTSEMLHKYRPSDPDISQTLPQQIQQRLLLRTKELFKTDNSKQFFGQAKSSMKNDKNQKRRNKSLSSSKSKLFSKAHQVNRNESFHKSSTIASNSKTLCIGANNFQFSQYRNDKSKAKVNDIVQRKLIIARVISDMQDSKPKLTLRGELLKNQLQKQKQSQTIGEIISKRNLNHESQKHHDLSESKVPSQLAYSKQFESEAKLNHSFKLENESLNLIPTQLNESFLKNYSKQLTSNIQQTIRKEMEERYLSKERQLEEKYIQKEKKYLEKFQNLQTVMESQLEKERNFILTNINSQIEKQFEKFNEIKSENKKQIVKAQPSKERKKSQQNIVNQQIEISKIVKQTNNVDRKTANILAIPRQNKNVQIEELYSFQQIKDTKTVQKSKPNPTELVQNSQQTSKTLQLISKTTKQKNLPNGKLNQPPNQMNNKTSNSNYNNSNYDIDDIEEINLNTQVQTKNNSKQAKFREDDRINKSFNMDKKLNSSFSSEKPIASKETKILRQQQKKGPPIRKQSEEEKQKIKEEERKIWVKNKLKQQIQLDAHLISIGEVAGYCSKFCKKSKVDWRISSLLLYRYCFDYFRSFKSIYQEAEQLKIIKTQQLEKYTSYDKVMEQNLAKMYKSINKKIVLSNAYKQIIESNQIELERLKPLAILQAKAYVQQLCKSNESRPRGGDVLVVQCGLRVINSVFIIKKLNGINAQTINQNIQQLNEEDTFALFEEWSQRLSQAQ